MLNLNSSLVALFLGLLLLGFQNCSPMKSFSIDQQEKQKALTSNVLCENCTSEPPAQPVPDSVKYPTTIDPQASSLEQINIRNASLCFENMESFSRTKTIIEQSISANLSIKDSTGKAVCLNTDKSKIHSGHSIYLPNCQLTAGTYSISLTAELKPGRFYQLLAKQSSQEDIGHLSFGQISFSIKSKPDSLMDIMSLVVASELPSVLDSNHCTHGASQIVSPLVIDLGPDASSRKTIDISSLEDGIMFNILGDRSYPLPQTKKRIGWTSNPRYGFLVLPNSNNQVLGINEMFGNNTRGPDGRFEANGYLALAKYDQDKDQLISRNDSVYHRLRVWTDLNYNGISEANELRSLNSAGIELIDLRYDPAYSETDKYGNQTTLKSVVKRNDGSYNIIFDLWFVYADK